MLRSNIFVGLLTYLFSCSVFATQDDVVYIDLETLRVVENVTHENKQGEGVVEQEKSVKCIKPLCLLQQQA